MRKIKFRGKCLLGYWRYGSLYVQTETDCEIITRNDDGSWGKSIVVPNTIGQFTGLHDKNGKEIYEGDILRDSSGFTAVVVAYKGAFRLLDYKSQIGDIGPAYNLLRENDFSIIGNVCDNKDLLK